MALPFRHSFGLCQLIPTIDLKNTAGEDWRPRKLLTASLSLLGPSVPCQLYTLLRRETAPRNCIKMVRRASFSYAVPWEARWHTGSLKPRRIDAAASRNSEPAAE